MWVAREVGRRSGTLHRRTWRSCKGAPVLIRKDGRRKFEKFLHEVGTGEEDEGVIDVESK
jgi:hypothetical protein